MFSSPSLRWSGLAQPGHVYRNYNLYSKIPDTQIEYNRMLHSTIQYTTMQLVRARPAMHVFCYEV